VTVGSEVEAVELPSGGVWRIGPATDPYEVRPPLTADELNHPKAGNRFDSPLASYSALYFCSKLQGCFGETLARYRPDPSIVPLIQGEWSSEGFMPPGEIPADWRLRRLAVRAKVAAGTKFLDVESIKTRAFLERRLAPILATFSASDLDVATIRSGDRRITRFISLWAWSQTDEEGLPLYGGIRYLSRLNSEWECWGLFDRLATEEIERRAITRNMRELKEVAKLWGLTVY
jgi:hypothetical protein